MTSAGTDGKTPAGILVRRVTFEYPDDLDAHWHPDMPEWSHVVNASSLLMPYLEPFLIQAVREALPRITDPALVEEAKAYIGQEAQHFRQHRRFNELVIAQGYEKLRAYERTLEADYEKIRAERDPDFRLAYAAAFETMALAIGHMLVRFRSEFFSGADPAVTSLVLWHFVEELEHKHAAFDVYQHVVGSYRLRVKGLVFTMFHTLRRTRQAYKMLLIEDGRWAGLRTRWELKKLMVRIFGYLTPWILEAATPWHRPQRFRDPDWVTDWIRLYDEGHGGLTELDTARIDEMPSTLVGAVE
jgi:predicted metal-dependent hydrolase